MSASPSDLSQTTGEGEQPFAPTDRVSADEIVFPPSDLPSDEPPLESSLHLHQLRLLMGCLNWLWRDRQDYFCTGNLTIHYSLRQLKSELFRGPDFFVVRDTSNQPRRSWVVWEEDGKYPNLIIELLSDSTAKGDRGLKKQIYQDIFRTPDYFWFDPQSLEFQGFHLLDGLYHPLEANESGWRWSQQLGLYLGVYEERLRFFTPEGLLVPTPEEVAESEQQRADREQQRAETERQANAKLRAKLQELGIDPEHL
ncbi:MAG: Uma2 family endonuclease [Phormidium sp. BM_Day4_Bin.17]|nr:Uma2 family endonuclease [Phormidium sp. BM_Day4_Bin.17]UCJ13748.1 MAG: Uma2 family endonuclease [Phormidium sp. PBR-2020]